MHAASVLDHIEALEEFGIINPNSVDLNTDNVDLERLHERSHYFTWGQGIEAEVPYTAQSVRTILPNMRELTARGLDIWEVGEVSHSEALAKPMQAAGIRFMPVKVPETDPPPTGFKQLGQLADLSPGMHDIVEYIYYVTGAVSERPTKKFYIHSFSPWLESIGMFALAASLTTPIGNHESMHEGLYIAAANEKRQQLSDFQLRIARKTIKHTLTPPGMLIGVTRQAKERREGFGQVARDVVEGDPEEFVRSTESMAARILGTEVEYMNRFLAKRYKQAIEAHEEKEREARKVS